MITDASYGILLIYLFTNLPVSESLYATSKRSSWVWKTLTGTHNSSSKYFLIKVYLGRAATSLEDVMLFVESNAGELFALSESPVLRSTSLTTPTLRR